MSSAPTPTARARQAAALQAVDTRIRHAEGEAKRSRTQIAAALNLGYDQYTRYVNGDTPLRTEQIAQFAAVYGVDARTLGHAILTGEIENLVTDWSMAEALKSHIPESEIPALVAEWADRSIMEQRAAVEGMKRNANRARERYQAAHPRNRSAS